MIFCCHFFFIWRKVALIDEKPKDFADCVRWARLNWQEQYSNQIRQLLFNFPQNYTTSSGQPFWTGKFQISLKIRFFILFSLSIYVI